MDDCSGAVEESVGSGGGCSPPVVGRGVSVGRGPAVEVSVRRDRVAVGRGGDSRGRVAVGRGGDSRGRVGGAVGDS